LPPRPRRVAVPHRLAVSVKVAAFIVAERV
jgi:hypothetical protein